MMRLSSIPPPPVAPMHPALVFAGTYGPDLAAWLLAHRDDLGDAFDRLSGLVLRALADPVAAPLDRVGGVLVSNGQAEVIGLLHRQSDTVRDVAAAVDGLAAGQEVLGRSLGLLTSLSMVGLGVSALSYAALAVQLAALTRRLDRLAAEVREVKGLIQADHRARLTAGLALLRSGEVVAPDDPAQAARFYGDAAADLTRAGANYAEQLRAGVGAADPGYPWVVVRHLTVAALGEAAAHLRLGRKDLAVAALEAALGPLRGHARGVFARTVGADPARFLIPALAAHGITLEGVAELYRQAGQAGAVGAGERLSAAGRFEALRGRLHTARDPRFRAGAAVRRLLADWAEACAAVEEVNRVRGLALAIAAYHTPGRSYPDLVAEILADVDARRPADGTCLAFFPAPAGG